MSLDVHETGTRFFPRFQAAHGFETGSYIYHGGLLLLRVRRYTRATHAVITSLKSHSNMC